MKAFSVPPQTARDRGTKCSGPTPPRTLGAIVGSNKGRIVVHDYTAAWIDLSTVAAYIRRLWAVAPEGGEWWSFQAFSEPALNEIDLSIESADGRRRPLELGNGYAHAMDAGCEWWARFLGPDRSRWIVR